MSRSKHLARGYSDDEELLNAQKNPNAIIHYFEDDYTIEYITPEEEVVKEIDYTDLRVKYAHVYTLIREYCDANCLHLFDKSSHVSFILFCESL